VHRRRGERWRCARRQRRSSRRCGEELKRPPGNIRRPPGLKIACFRKMPVRPGCTKLALPSDGDDSKLLFRSKEQTSRCGWVTQRERYLPRLTPVANGGFFLRNAVRDRARSHAYAGSGPRPFLRSPADIFFRKTPGSNPSHKLPRELPRAKRRPGPPRKTSRPSLGSRHQPWYREICATEPLR